MPCIDCMTPTKAGKTYQLEMDSERTVQMLGTLTKQVTNMSTIFEEQSRLVDHRFADIEASIQHDKESVNGEELNHDRMNARDGKKRHDWRNDRDGKKQKFQHDYEQDLD
ncbi:hypothetical protein GBA52_008111 [Prunus armeniaca]|nr:hypothetical protein GBA52_008111 [Prunus armeniaca]